MSPGRIHSARDTIPLGDIELHDDYLPGLQAGDYSVKVTHDLRTGTGSGASSIIDGGQFQAVQQFTVRGPQVSIDTGAVVATQPPDGAVGRFAEVLPHVVLGDPMLPWERAMDGAPAGTPWLALLVLTDDQLTGAATDPTRTISATVRDFLTPDPAVLKPGMTLEADIDQDTPCRYIQVTAEDFQAVAPRLEELRFLAHCRGANTGDRPILGIDEDGLFSVIVAGRFPAAAPPDSATGAKNIVHLVSLEGHQKILVDNPDFTGHTSVALLSLYSWSLWCHADPQADFRELAEGLTRRPHSTETAPREEMWLRLTSPYPDTDDTADPRRQVARRLDDGYVPLPYVTRSGETTYGWYRGPLTPVVPATTPQAAGATSADELIGYDPAWGTFDLSLAAAFETGRALALADSAFAQHLTALKRGGRTLVDALYHQATSTHLPAGGGPAAATARAAFGAMLDGHLLTVLGAPPPDATGTWSPPAPAAPPGDQAKALADFLDSAQTRSAITDALGEAPLKDDLAPVANWLGQRLLLNGVPFTQLVADERMLPPESLRFFHLDPNWLDALVSGALSIGAQSSRDTLQDQIMGDAVRAAAAQEAAAHRDTQRGITRPRPTRGGSRATAAPGRISGFLLRSAIVSGWPNLVVRGYDPTGQLLPVLRMDHLSPTVLLCLFDGIPDTVELREPHEGFRFGVDDDGLIPLRHLLPPTLGDPFPYVTFRVLDHLRTGTGLVLDLGSLVPALGQALDTAHGTPVGPLGPADLALQMVRVPEAICFNGPADQTEEK
ncbi:hypothetical protein Misp01_64930 [Microtetraspora sp. NBRC 13810]|uniref:hypothetical protein n=1 Tax=Microtetraspora sp. NBRC 13810 TaxID=3030990 RepID=UPI0024A395B9|nr:hypothetical protein [Microtetraspora sp. NBRC 13810]GLW11365.1 hypothetical protein Misp01_64930 [Microtetraspora sp. NBRC 13810]